ncbi:MAG: ribose 5-phosphate isomerase B [Oscillospiraceae bacterium]|nr:ribose 5-phosphate isomerase B [Oscillospiraceae bacterium]
MIAIACDHGGYALKMQILEHLAELGVAYEDFGCGAGERVDYPVYAEKVARAVAAGQFDRGILICGTGIGMSIAANKIPGIRAALCADCYSAEMTRLHNDANILCLGGRTLGSELAKRIVDTYLAASFSEAEHHARRLEMIRELEK